MAVVSLGFSTRGLERHPLRLGKPRSGDKWRAMRLGAIEKVEL
ncbi:hypothetical protein RBSWK_00219 [Rhodopirellula baltica SWK14]|uniref:Uncharacterized protein n=1 Tax=Rhodopirellula baltica SWK14 TaxID=993516 RepID=L7CQ83_RHOBT|nr:hypothetical protein RBSWK_00219 [Rhodopirellula baltica SWK14]